MKTVMASIVAVSLGFASTLSASTAFAAPTERGAADAVALVVKADPVTRAKGSLHVDKGLISSSKLTVRIANTAAPQAVGLSQVVPGPGVDYVARPTEGGLQVAAIIDKATSLSQSYQFVGKSLELLPSGWVLVRDDPKGRPVAVIGAPWAVDAVGASLRSTFTVKGDVLTQTTVATSTTSFPVVADPIVSWGILGADVTFTKSETKSIASKTGYAQTASAVCAIFPIPVAVGCGALMAIWSTMLDKTFNNAAAAGKCVKMFVPYTAVLIPSASLSTVKCP